MRILLAPFAFAVMQGGRAGRDAQLAELRRRGPRGGYRDCCGDVASGRLCGPSGGAEEGVVQRFGREFLGLSGLYAGPDWDAESTGSIQGVPKSLAAPPGA